MNSIAFSLDVNENQWKSMHQLEANFHSTLFILEFIYRLHPTKPIEPQNIPTFRFWILHEQIYYFHDYEKMKCTYGVTIGWSP